MTRRIGAILVAILCALRTGAALTPDPIDPADFATFADEQINAAIARGECPGAAIVLVENGRIAFTRGYGVADRQTLRPIDPQTTAFRVGSLSKVFTTIAVLQQVERGKIALSDTIQSRLPDVPLRE